MKVLWLVSVTIPAAAAACGLDAREIGGGWLTGAMRGIREAPNAPSLLLCSVDARVTCLTTGSREGVQYALLPDGSAEGFAALLADRKPDLVHIWGTEYPAASAMLKAARQAGIPVLVGIQGVMRACAEHLNDGVPARYLHTGWLEHRIDRVVPGWLPDVWQARFDDLAAREANLLRQAGYVTGRTGFDRQAVAALAPAARYYPCNETLRPEFYQPPVWHPRTFGTAPVLLLSQGNYPLKNLHTLLQAMPAVLERFPGAVLRVAGWPPLDKGPLLRPVIRRMFPYQTYCRRLIDRLGLAGHVQYTGPLDAAAMRQAYLDADLYLLTSFTENSPNSLGEAMLLGLPCVASRAGGIPDMMLDGSEGLVYGEAGDAEALAAAILQVLSAPDHGAEFGEAARRRALVTHDPAKNAADLLAIYAEILNREEPS
ncbi:MAG: glycosyltransferase [Gemmiger sp.]|uniref:glycosyltransferase family 4 protein n=1 Tax=Gemmiger sp. TaxID=2049027 RepID=UPI002E766840|nr:glycosyltransferase [Gemmiger sp.]MEE0800039.1 glycosyltransferase [Gemmiger sp.]